MKKLILASLILVMSVVTTIGLNEPVLAVDSKTAVCEGIGLGGNAAGCNTSGSGTDISSLIASVINIFSLIVGVAAVIMIIIGGFKYITSQGDSNAVSGAKNTILYALVGLVIVALAQFIVRFVLGRVS